MSILLISIAAFVGVAALVGAVAVIVRGAQGTEAEERLAVFTGTGKPKDKETAASVLAQALEDRPGVFELLVSRIGKLRLLFEQADTSMTPTMFFAITGGLAGAGWMLAWVTRCPLGLYPVGALVLGMMPLFWLMMRRRRRLKKFAAQLPDALELIARALRAGHSLSAAFALVQDEAPLPICEEFGRVFEEQNLGIAMEEALRGMADRVPNLDLKFFVTALILQRQTGGDLAEILDKIGNLIRERFKIWGQVQALTGEGRLSGVVLLALPPLLFVAAYRLNPDYIMILFEDPMGIKMLVGAVVMQVIGALVIRKIVNIKV